MEEKGVPYQYKEVNPYKKEKHFLGIKYLLDTKVYLLTDSLQIADINPKGLVPALEYKNRALYESLIICEFIEDAYPDHTPHLLRKDPFERAQARLWIDHISKSVVPAVNFTEIPLALLF